MPLIVSPAAAARLSGGNALSIEINTNGSIRRMDCGATTLSLFVGNEVEGGPANLFLRRRSDRLEWLPLLGSRSPTRFQCTSDMLVGTGSWLGIDYTLTLSLAGQAAAWFWHLQLQNTTESAHELELSYAQDLALAPYGTVRQNEYYVSQYVDHTPLVHPSRGCVVASRQNLAAAGRHPWCVIGSLRKGVSFATDALQFYGLATRAGNAPAGLLEDLPGRRLQHEHSMVVIQDDSMRLPPGGSATAGFFGYCLADHPHATSAHDLCHVDAALALPQAQPIAASSIDAPAVSAATLFTAAPLLTSLDLDDESLRALFGTQWRHEEVDESGVRLSFFHGADRHVVLREKELRVQRPHGHILRTGRHATPDETALTSTLWMSGVFNSMLTQGHVSINRCLSTVRSYLSLFRSHGQRVFVELGEGWRLLDVPSAFEMAPDACRWIYRHAEGEIQVRVTAGSDSHELTLSMEVTAGPAVRFLVSHHVSLNGDDGGAPGCAHWRHDGNAVVMTPAPGSELAARFPQGSFHLVALAGTQIEAVGGDELLFLDRRSRQQPYICVVIAPARSVGLRLEGRLVASAHEPLHLPAGPLPGLRMDIAATSPHADHIARLADIAPWFAHNALVHYLAPRGLEQYSGGGWGTRDVCQGPLELLLTLGQTAPVRDLLLRVMSAQSADGDWPQWFMFFDRERDIRAGDSHGDIVFWPLLALGQYLLASGDAGLLEEPVPFFTTRSGGGSETATVWQHVQRALAVIERRVISGTALAAYGHGDWNDALQPADPAMREHMCSAWTVTLHYQMLTTLARALRLIGRDSDAARLEHWADAVRRDFQRLLIVDGVLAGYALFESAQAPRYLLHPADTTTGVRYSSLAMIHAILEGLLTPAQAREHLRLIEQHLSGPDGVRLFDRPMPYHGGPQRYFQRAESAAFFGREIGLMYMHAHLRYAQALAHLGAAQRFFDALCQAQPIGLRAIVPGVSLRQANCYYSSSDAAFADRYQASAEYERVLRGTIALDGGWRIYSSGAGIALGLIVRRLLGVSAQLDALSVDPVMPATLDGLRARTALLGRPVAIDYRVRGSGCGVNSVELNGQLLPFSYETNPYRRGAARVALTHVRELLDNERNSMRIDVGSE